MDGESETSAVETWNILELYSGKSTPETQGLSWKENRCGNSRVFVFVVNPEVFLVVFLVGDVENLGHPA